MAAKRRSRRHNFLLRFCAAAFAVYVAFSLVSIQLDVSAERRELESLNASVEAQQAENAQLEHLLEYGDEREFIEYMAREKLGYAYPDEKILIDSSAN